MLYAGQPLSQFSSIESELIHRSKLGLAIIVSNDYVSNKVGLSELHGTHNDAHRTSAAFNTLGYEVVAWTNLTSSQLNSIISEAATSPHPPSYNRLVFVFNGYGISGSNLIFDPYKFDIWGHIYSQEGKILHLAKLVNSLSSCKHPKLLFFNLCPILLPKGLSKFGLLNPDGSPKESNVLVACSSVEFIKRQSWIEDLANKILTQNRDISKVLNDFPLSPSINLLEEPVNFFAEGMVIISNCSVHVHT